VRLALLVRAVWGVQRAQRQISAAEQWKTGNTLELRSLIDSLQVCSNGSSPSCGCGALYCCRSVPFIETAEARAKQYEIHLRQVATTRKIKRLGRAVLPELAEGNLLPLFTPERTPFSVCYAFLAALVLSALAGPCQASCQDPVIRQLGAAARVLHRHVPSCFTTTAVFLRSSLSLPWVLHWGELRGGISHSVAPGPTWATSCSSDSRRNAHSLVGREYSNYLKDPTGACIGRVPTASDNSPFYCLLDPFPNFPSRLLVRG
jgi:hypothetical protein